MKADEQVYKHHHTEGELTRTCFCCQLTVIRDRLLQQDGRCRWCRRSFFANHINQLIEGSMGSERRRPPYIRPKPRGSNALRPILSTKPQPHSTSLPSPEPSQELIAVYNKYPNLDANAPFNPKVFKTHLDEVFENFGRHMVDEIKTLNKENIEKIGEKN